MSLELSVSQSQIANLIVYRCMAIECRHIGLGHMTRLAI